MRIRSRKSRTLVTTVATIAAVGLLVPAAALAQAPEGWTPPRTPDGQPDLQGVWANNNITPLERPEAWADKESLTDEELAALERRDVVVRPDSLEVGLSVRRPGQRPALGRLGERGGGDEQPNGRDRRYQRA